jgi:NADH-quinone oxidoreductase subunit E
VQRVEPAAKTAGPGPSADPRLPALSAAARAELERLAPRYATREALLLPALWLVQGEHGWVSEAAMEELGVFLGVSAVRVYSVATFYHMFHTTPPGRYNIQVCHNISCSLCGAEKLLGWLHAELGVGADEPTPDGRFMIQRVECLGACEHAPCCQINDEFHFDLTAEKLKTILDALP